MKDTIDVVIMWVDGSDREWLKQKNKYSENKSSIDASINRYRNWDNLQYVFRGIEVNMPWVHTIHFVTWGHLPKWLDTTNPKLNVVRHEDYIPQEYLPTFSANPIEMNLHRIPGIADHFILFNDDMFVIHPTHEELFFAQDGLPKEQVSVITLNSRGFNEVMPHLILNNNALINSSFSPRKISIRQWGKMLSIRNGLNSVSRSLLLLPFSLGTIQVPDVPHMPSPFLKSTLEDVWRKHADVLHQTSSAQFRSITDVNQYLLKQWQVLSDNFHPINLRNKSTYVGTFPKDIKKLERALGNSKRKLLCINDGIINGDFEQVRDKVNELLDQQLSNKSSFEL